MAEARGRDGLSSFPNLIKLWRGHKFCHRAPSENNTLKILKVVLIH